MNAITAEIAATMTADQLETSLRALATHVEMRGETGAAATYRQIADEVESLNPIYAQTHDPDRALARARAALVKGSARVYA